MATTRGTDVYVALKEQVDLFTQASDTQLVTGDYLAFESEGMQGSRQIVQSRAIRRSSMRKRAYTANGTIAAGGSLEFTGSQLILHKLLPLATHTAGVLQWVVNNAGVETPAAAQDGTTPNSYQKVTMTPTSLARAGEETQGVYRHRYTLVDGGRLQPFTTFVGMTGGSAQEGNYTRVFKGCKVNSMSLGARVNEFLKLTTDIQGLKKDIQDGVRTPTYPTDEVEYSYLFTGASVKIKAGNMQTLGELSVSSFDMEVNHNLGTDDYRLGDITRQSLDEGVTEVTGSFEMSAGSASLSGAELNANSGLYNDRAFFERLNLEGKYASLEVVFADWTRPITETAIADGSTRTVLKVADASISVKAGDLIQVAGLEPVRVTSVDTANKTVTLSGTGLPAVPTAGDTVAIASHLRVTLPFVRLEEPDFNVRDENTIRGSARFSAYDSIIFDHVYRL